MSIKSFIQLIILIIIMTIIGSVYFQYFSKEKIVIEENSDNEKLYNDLEKKIIELEEKNKQLQEEIEIKITNLNKKETKAKLEEEQKLLEAEAKLVQGKKQLEEEEKLLEAEAKLAQEKKQLEEEKKLLEAEAKLAQEKKQLEEEKKLLNSIKENDTKKEKPNNKNKNKLSNTLKDVEYISIDKKGNKFKLLARSAKSNKNDNNFLDLDFVRGVITSEIREPIYIISDFGQYNTTNFNSKFYQNVKINYMEKQILCENFDIDMETNKAIAYNNVIVTDPQSTMKAGIITFDLKTKDININPTNEDTKVKVITN